MDLIDNYFDNGINVNIKYPTFCHLQSGLLQLPPSQARKVFCSAATNYPDRCNLPCLQPALSSTSLSSPLLPPPPPAAGGCSHQILNSGPGIQGSSGSRTHISAGYGLSAPASLCSATTGHLALHSPRQLRHHFTWP